VCRVAAPLLSVSLFQPHNNVYAYLTDIPLLCSWYTFTSRKVKETVNRNSTKHPTMTTTTMLLDSLKLTLGEPLVEKILTSRILVVGAGVRTHERYTVVELLNRTEFRCMQEGYHIIRYVLVIYLSWIALLLLSKTPHRAQPFSLLSST
jgi:hypothetical protein